MLFPALSKVCLIDALDYGEMVTIFGAKGKSISFPHLKCVHGFLSFSSDSKLENQLPWMVLEHLFSMFTAPVSDMTLIELAIAFFCDIYAFRQPARSHDYLRDIKHIPDLVKKGIVSSIEVDEEKIPQSGWELIPSATHLVEAGIKLRKSRSKNMLDIKFEKGVLAIPPIRIHETTETVFRNLISYELCYPNSDDRITSYAMLLDNLIDTAKDVEILCENGIICNWLNTEDAARFFNKLYHRTCVVNR